MRKAGYFTLGLESFLLGTPALGKTFLDTGIDCGIGLTHPATPSLSFGFSPLLIVSKGSLPDGTFGD